MKEMEEKQKNQKILQNKYNRKNWITFLKHNISAETTSYQEQTKITTELKKHSIADKILKIGFIQLKCAETDDKEDYQLPIIEVKLTDYNVVRKNKIALNNLAKDILKSYTQSNGLLVVFYNDTQTEWRFSFIGYSLGDKETETIPQKYTYVFGTENQFETALERFENLKQSNLELKDFFEAFSVEALNKKFYQEIQDAFDELITKRNKYLKFLKTTAEQVDKRFSLRLIGRVLFCWFLKQKLGGELADLLTSVKITKTKNYYNEILEKLFFETLNKSMKDRENSEKGFEKIPYLNGGLFEAQTGDFYNKDPKTKKPYVSVDNAWLKNFFKILESYNFTIYEDHQYDQIVEIDPEMLGTIFENLLAYIDPDTNQSARKSTGSFYTPRLIVDYMVEQSLINYLINYLNADDSLNSLTKNIEDLVINNNDDNLTTEKKEAIINALDNIKILDPACGSGAFPIGMLNKIVGILQTIDKNNNQWLDKQLNRIADESLKAEAKKELVKKDLDYIRKLGILRNSIYGVDIQPMAVEISRLRCFLSLIIDEEIKPAEEKNNMGVMPLPNLEFKFVCADTLIGLEQPKKQTSLFDIFNNNKNSKDKQLKKLMNEYLVCSDKNRKDGIKQEFEKTQDNIIADLEKIGDKNFNKLAKQLTKWQPFDNKQENSWFNNSWFNSEWMFGVNFFDVVIGNPPYIQLQKNGGALASKYQNQNFKSFKRSGDIYTLFYEWGINNLKQQGILSFITSNKWMRAGYGKSLRKFFTENTKPIKLIDLGAGVFASATVDSNILLLKKLEQQDNKLTNLTAYNLTNTKHQSIANINQVLTNQKPQSIDCNQDGDSWLILNELEQQLKQKIDKLGTPLKDWDIKINYGIKTGYNKAFIIDTKTKEKLCKQDPKSAEIIKPILRGRDIKRYSSNWAGLWIILTKYESNKYLINDYQVIYNHLLNHKDTLKNRGQCKNRGGKGQHHWLELDNNPNDKYLKQFEQEKIVWNRITDNLRFSLVEKDIFILDSSFFFIGSNISYLLSVVNSQLLKYWVRNNAARLGDGVYGAKIYVENLPIPKITKKKQQPFVDLVDTILAKKAKQQDTTAEENKINQMVYKLYDLTDEEIKLVESGK